MLTLLVATLAVGSALPSARFAAAPATASYQEVERTITEIRKSWSEAGARRQPNRPGWDAIFDALLADLQSYSKAGNEEDRLAALDHIYQISEALGAVRWHQAVNLREEIRQWLRPRVRLAWARQRLHDAVKALKPTTDPKVQANRDRWLDFDKNDLGNALRDYDNAATMTPRHAALDRIHESLKSLHDQNKGWSWWPAHDLETAVNDLFNRPNIDVSADVDTVEPLFSANLVASGPVYRKGYISQVTAGPKTGFGLLSSDDGIAFYNRQAMTSVTPIWDFQNQVASDPQGQRAVRLYQFSATTYDWSELTVTTLLKDTGLELYPSYQHAIDAGIASAPTPQGALGRAIASLVGMNQTRINARVYQGSIGQFRQRIPVEALEEAQERIVGEAARRNEELRSRGLRGNGELAIRDFLIKQLSLRSRPAAVFVGGLFEWPGAPGQFGADAPLPQNLNTIDPGITARVHLGSLLSSLVAGLYQRDAVQSLDNLMVAIKPVPPGTPPREAVTLTKNTDFATFAKAVEAARKSKPGSPRVVTLRITRPKQPPVFGTDARGFFVAMIHDLQIEVPAPEEERKGGMVGAAAQIYRIKVPQAEISLSYEVDSPKPDTLQLHAKVVEFNPGSNAQVLAITDDETKGVPLSRFSTGLVIATFGGRLRAQPIELALETLEIPGLTIRSLSPLDPSGWVRIGLVRKPGAPPLTAARPAN
jgi:hypothetical protein